MDLVVDANITFAALIKERQNKVQVYSTEDLVRMF